MAALNSHFDEVVVRPGTTPLSAGELRTCLKEFDGVLPTLGDTFGPTVFEDAADPKCKVLANFGVGYNHIDIAGATGAGILVTNTPDAVTDATADIGVMLMLMSSRRASEGERLVRDGKWMGWHPTQMLGLHVTGKTVGIVGMGAHRASDRRAVPFWLWYDGEVFQSICQRAAVSGGTGRVFARSGRIG